MPMRSPSILNSSNLSTNACTAFTRACQRVVEPIVVASILPDLSSTSTRSIGFRIVILTSCVTGVPPATTVTFIVIAVDVLGTKDNIPVVASIAIPAGHAPGEQDIELADQVGDPVPPV